MLLAVCCDLGDAMRCALSCTSILSSMLQLTRWCLVSVWLLAGDAGPGSRAMREGYRGALELQRSLELTMLASLGAEVLVLARCGVGGGCGATGWRS